MLPTAFTIIRWNDCARFGSPLLAESAQQARVAQQGTNDRRRWRCYRSRVAASGLDSLQLDVLTHPAACCNRISAPIHATDSEISLCKLMRVSLWSANKSCEQLSNRTQTEWSHLSILFNAHQKPSQQILTLGMSQCRCLARLCSQGAVPLHRVHSVN